MSYHITSEGVRPLNNTRENPAVLHGWYVWQPRDAHEVVRLGGEVTNHPKAPSGDRAWGVITTQLEEMPGHWPLREGDLVRTLNTWYRLGVPQVFDI